MFEYVDRWNGQIDFNWESLRNEWLKYWDLGVSILLEKSPPNIIRANSIEKHFEPAYFMVFYRNPYAHCESLLRRHNLELEKAALFTIYCLRYQQQNIESLNNVISFSYEDLTDSPEKSKQSLIQYIPELCDINLSK